MVEVRIRKFFGAMNAVLGQIGGVCRSDKVWSKIMDMKLSPVLAFGSHFWDYDKSDVSYMVKLIENIIRDDYKPPKLP